MVLKSTSAGGSGWFVTVQDGHERRFAFSVIGHDAVADSFHHSDDVSFQAQFTRMATVVVVTFRRTYSSTKLKTFGNNW